jgi:hypothetical protein
MIFLHRILSNQLRDSACSCPFVDGILSTKTKDRSPFPSAFLLTSKLPLSTLRRRSIGARQRGQPDAQRIAMLRSSPADFLRYDSGR